MKAETAVIGGSGFYQFLEGEEVEIETPFGRPSDKILLAQYQGQSVAFLPRHGKNHHLPPHRINYRANLSALKQLGVKQVLAPCAAGSLKKEMKPGDLVIADQLIDRTKNRKDTFFDGPKAAHVSMAEPFCPFLRDLAARACQSLRLSFHQKGVLLVIEGPRFSTKAESNFYAGFADIINMTQYPESVLARELEMCYLNISLITDYDAGLKDEKEIKPVSAQEVVETFRKNSQKLKELVLEIIKLYSFSRSETAKINCHCQNALKNALI